VTDAQELVLSTGNPPQVGRVVAEADRELTIRWADGRETKAKAGSAAYRRVRPGGVTEMYATAPDHFQEAFSERPLDVFVAALAESRDEAKAADLSHRISSLGLEEAAVKAAWTKVKPKFDKHPHVIKGEARGSYRWSETAQDPLGWIDTLTRLQALKQLTQSKNTEPEAERLDARLASLVDEPWSQADAMLAWGAGRRDDLPGPLDAGEAELDDKSIALILQRAENEHRQDVLTYLALTGRGRAANAALMALDEAGRVALAIDAFTRLASDDPSSVAGATAFLDRFSSLPEHVGPTVVAVALAARLDGGLAVDQAGLDVLDRFLEPSRADIDLLRDTVRAQDRLPPSVLGRGRIARGSFRLRLLTAVLGTQHEPALSVSKTWQGLGLDQLVDLIESAHPLTGPLLDSDGAPGVEIATSWLRRQAQARVAVGGALQWPATLLAAVPQELLASLVERARSEDPLARELLRDPALPAAEARLVEQEAAFALRLEHAARERDEALAELDSVTKRLQWAEDRLRGTRSETEGAYLAQMRQAQIDAVRALAGVLDRVFEADQGGTAWRAALEAARGFGVVLLGTVDETVGFDASRHEVVGGATGTQVVVRRPGYAWISKDENIVLVRALVTPAP
jgi:hypothetical protein